MGAKTKIAIMIAIIIGVIIAVIIVVTIVVITVVIIVLFCAGTSAVHTLHSRYRQSDQTV